MFKVTLTRLITALGLIALISCSGGTNTPSSTNQGLDSVPGLQAATDQGTVADWPTGLPTESLQPWEMMNQDGFAVPAQGWPRSASSLNLESDFTPGVERFTDAGNIVDYGEALSFSSGNVGERQLSYAIYRVLGGGAPLGIVTTDVNLYQRNDSKPSEYWIGVADYDLGGWSWHGPFTDSHVRVQVSDGDHESVLGNHFICVAAYDGSRFDVVGIGINSNDLADVVAPNAPGALIHTDFGSSTMLEWLPVPDADIAGYRVYYNHRAFTDANSSGVRAVNYLIGQSKYLLTGLSDKTYVRVAAVDVSGNEGLVSEMVTCLPLGEESINATLEIDVVSGMIGDTFNLVASGGNTYDFDLDGDGTFDIMGNGAGTASLIATQTGIIRPLVRAHNTGGTSIAMGAVSLIVSGNSRPVVQGFVSPAFGVAPLEVQFTSNQVDIDGDIVEYIWDFNSDGIVNFRFSTAGGAIDPPPFTFTTPGTYNAKVRVWDDKGAWDVDTVTIHVKDFVGFDWNSPTNHTGQSYSDFAIVDGHPAFTYFNTNDSTFHFIRATNSKGTQWADSQQIDPLVAAGLFSSLSIVNGVPAVAYFDTGVGLCYLFADDPQGSSWSTPRIELDIVPVGAKASLETVDGNPAIGYIESGNARYIRADSIDGSTWGNPPVEVDGSGGVSLSLDMEVIDGNPAMAYYDAGKAYYIRATSSTGNVVGDWADPRVNVSGIANCGGWVALEQVNGRPAISYFEVTGTSMVAYHRALNSTGQTSLDWSAGFLEIESGSGCGQWSNLGVVNGKPVVCFFMAEGFPGYYFCSASNPDGTSWDNPIAIIDGNSMTIGEYPVILEHDNSPYVGCLNLSTSQLFFARPVFE